MARVAFNRQTVVLVVYELYAARSRRFCFALFAVAMFPDMAGGNI